jgi:glutathione S-transferase
VASASRRDAEAKEGEIDAMITVYGAPPTRALRVLWMLEEMGLPYQARPVDFANRHQDAEFMAASPTGAIPGIKDGDVTMMESVAIMEYLGARYGPTPIVPEPRDADFPLYQQFLHFGEAGLAAPLNVALGSRFFAPEAEKSNWGATFAVQMVTRRSKALADQLDRSAYAAGERFTAADISCGYALGLAEALGFADDLDPALGDYLARLRERPAFQKASQPNIAA